ncbi:hypothetical protein [Frankia sp. R82]|uniref:hypothetical protein n=1 Tax=Frankia sp. R82 TaxID=2950553 RepID=UPI0020434E3C|nr:hypothetical protein [Frankia sp. R82]MCM3883104.1 hypothetical protein [Frankia sp. R82]
MLADNSHHLAAAAQQRSLACTARVHAILDDLEHTADPVSVAAVAAKANVSRTFLYDPAQQALLARLRGIAAGRDQSSTRSARPAGHRISAESHEHVVRALRNRISRLTTENARLNHELATALGQLRDLRRTRGPQRSQPSTENGAPL